MLDFAWKVTSRTDQSEAQTLFMGIQYYLASIYYQKPLQHF